MTALDELLEQSSGAASFARQGRILGRVVQNRRAHALFLNTLARLEYVGVRKLLKSRRAESLDAEGLQHILEEAVHATRLKKFARALAADPEQVRTFSDVHTLAGDAAEGYFQKVDTAATETVTAADPDLCCLMTSTTIEIRAKLFYPAYQTELSNVGSTISVRSIIEDETEHLEQMLQQVTWRVPSYRDKLARVLLVEEQAYSEFLDAVETRLGALETLDRVAP